MSGPRAICARPGCEEPISSRARRYCSPKCSASSRLSTRDPLAHSLDSWLESHARLWREVLARRDAAPEDDDLDPFHRLYPGIRAAAEAWEQRQEARAS